MKIPHPDHWRAKKIIKEGYRQLLRAYPQAIRLEYAEEMDEVFSDRVEEVSAQDLWGLCWLGGSEWFHTSAAILRAYASHRNRYLNDAFHTIGQGLRSLFQVDPPGKPDGRSSWPQAILEISLLAFLGLVLFVSSYLPLIFQGSGNSPLYTLVWIVPVLWLVVGLAHGLPRWALPAVGISLAACFFASLITQTYGLLGLVLLSGALLIVLAFRVDRRTKFLPPIILRWRENLSVDLSRLSFAAYGILPLAIIVAFDDAYINNRTPCLMAAAFGMVVGALAYSRSRKAVWQWCALQGGVTSAMLLAVIDHTAFTPFTWKGIGWIFSLWLILSVFILIPFIVKFSIHLQHNWKSRPSPGG